MVELILKAILQLRYLVFHPVHTVLCCGKYLTRPGSFCRSMCFMFCWYLLSLVSVHDTPFTLHGNPVIVGIGQNGELVTQWSVSHESFKMFKISVTVSDRHSSSHCQSLFLVSTTTMPIGTFCR